MLLEYFKMRGQLSPSQKKFLQSLELEGSFKISSLLKELAFLGKMDAAGDKSRKTLGYIIAISLILAFFSALILVHISPLLLAITEVILISLAITSAIFMIILKKGDLDNNLRLFTIPFLGILKEEMHQRGKINLSLCAKNPFNKSFLFDEKQLPPRSNGYVTDHRTIFYYKQVPLKGNVTFSDNTDFAFEFIDFSQKIKIKKVRSAKTKYKEKHKKAIKLNLCLTFPKSTYARNEAGNTNMPLVITENEQSIKVKGKVVFKTLQKDATAPLNPSIDAIQQMYKAVKPI